MRNYEMVTLINPGLDEEGISKTIEKLDKFIVDNGGVLEQTDVWGKRKLAYPLKKFMEASYILARFNLEPEVVKEMKGELRGWEEVLRFLVVRVEG